MEGLAGEARRCPFEGGEEIRREVVSVENRGAGLERGGDSVLERHDDGMAGRRRI